MKLVTLSVIVVVAVTTSPASSVRSAVIAKALGVPVAQVHRLAEKHGLPVFRNGRVLSIRRSALVAWLVAFRSG